MEITDTDFDIVLRTVWGEARGEDSKGIIAVAWVMRNRTHDSRWPDTIGEVCLQPKQFSVWNDNDHNRMKMFQANYSKISFMKVSSLVSGVFAGLYADPTGGANHYHTTSINPRWADRSKITAQIGNHIFYKL